MSKKHSFAIFSFIIIIAVILLLIFFNFQGWLAVPQNIVYQAASPFLKFFSWTGNRLSDGLSFFFILKDLADENYQLKSQNQSLKQENFSMRETVKINEQLFIRLGLDLPSGKKVVMADVVGYNPELGQYILINKGSLDGLKEGFAVVDENNFLIGRIFEADSHSSKVILISDSNSLINALTQESRVAGVVKGSHGLGLVMEMIPIDQQIKEGEIVFTSGLNDFLPKNLIIGQVKEVIKNESEIFQKALVQASVDLSRLERVFVLVP
jgi:rod shape-determining protein MreC